MGIKHLRKKGLGCSNHTGLWLWGQICQLEVTDPYKSLLGLVMGTTQGERWQSCPGTASGTTGDVCRSQHWQLV